MKSMVMAIMAVAVAVTFSAPAFAGRGKTEKTDVKKGSNTAHELLVNCLARPLFRHLHNPSFIVHRVLKFSYTPARSLTSIHRCLKEFPSFHCARTRAAICIPAQGKSGKTSGEPFHLA